LKQTGSQVQLNEAKETVKVYHHAKGGVIGHAITKISRFLGDRSFVKQLALSYRTVVCPVCNDGVLWPNGWMDQDATWYEGIGLGPGQTVT